MNQGCHCNLSFATILVLKADEEHQAALWYKVDLGKLRESHENILKKLQYETSYQIKSLSHFCVGACFPREKCQNILFSAIK